MNALEIVGGFGSVVIQTANEKEQPHPTTFNIAPLSVGEELQFNEDIKALIRADRKRNRDDQLIEVGALQMTDAVSQYINGLLSYSLGEISQYHINAKRQTLEGTAVELWHRAKKTQPALRREEVQACLTVTNWEDVWDQLLKIIIPKTAHKS